MHKRRSVIPFSYYGDSKAPVVVLEYDGHNVAVILDTGSDISLLSIYFRDKFNIKTTEKITDFDVYNFGDPLNLSLSSVANFKLRLTENNFINVEGVCNAGIDNIRYYDGDTEPTIFAILGNDVLSKYNVDINYDTKIVTFIL